MFPVQFNCIPGQIYGTSLCWEKNLSLGKKCTYAKGTLFQFVDREYGSRFAYIKSGLICSRFISREPDNLRTHFYIGSGALVGELHCLVWNEGDCSLSKCMRDTEVYFFPGNLINSSDFRKEHQELAENILESVALKLYNLNLMGSIADKTARYKLIWYLIRLAEHAKSNRFISNITQLELCELLAINISSMTRAIRYIKATGILLQFTKNNIAITSLDALKELLRREGDQRALQTW